MDDAAPLTRVRVGIWLAERDSGELGTAGRRERVEPKVMDLLLLLASRAGEVVPRERIFATLWPGMVVGEDTLARTVSKLRRALGDDARAPRYVETLSKRGYRLIAPVSRVDAVGPDAGAGAESGMASAPVTDGGAALPSPTRGAARAVRRARRAWAASILLACALLLVFAVLVLRPWAEPRGGSSPPAAMAAQTGSPDLVARADDFYFQYTHRDNTAAIALYQRVLDAHPDHAPALAGLANALVQQQMRWPPAAGVTYARLGDALAAGHLRAPAARRELARAQQLAERAATLAPDQAVAHRALGLALSAQGRLDDALDAYRAALAQDPEAWGAMINIGDVLEIQGQPAAALPWYERAFDAMTRAYAHESARVRPWHSALGVLIGDRHRRAGTAAQAELWYRRVLAEAPLHAGALAALIQLKRDAGDTQAAAALCREHAQIDLPEDACPLG